ncbi:hypothetical protein KEJ29_05400 [Candidatus Bathyarchaeota archaeon]|nr:hypothetical protein [Candidatus Bathyarchaeota archaeon]
MRIDLLLPSILLSTIIASLLLYRKVEKRIRSIIGDRKVKPREVFLIVASMGALVTLVILLPGFMLQIIFLFAYSYMLLIFSYVILNRWTLAFIPPVAFITAYLSVVYLMPEENIASLLFMNLSAALFAVMATVYINSMFPWKVTLIFASLLTVMDFIQVFLTGHMVEAAYKMESLRLPVMLYSQLARLGAGDAFLSGLLSVQAAARYGVGAGFTTAATIAASLFIFEVLALNSYIGYSVFPATIIVLLGWLLGLAIYFLGRKYVEGIRKDVCRS